MKVLTWNINKGGSLQRINSITQQINNHSADLVLLCEYWSGEKGEELQKQLREYGYEYITTSNGEAKQNHLLLASRSPFELIQSTFQGEINKERWLEIKLTQQDLYILGVHIPTSQDKQGKNDFWRQVNDFASKHINDKAVILGDCNTGLSQDAQGVSFYGMEFMRNLLDIGWIDTWRYTHGQFSGFSWYSTKGNGFRVDHIFVSPLLREGILESYFSHYERINKISDHSVLITELEI